MNKIKVVSFYVARLIDSMIIALPVYIIFRWIFINKAIATIGKSPFASDVSGFIETPQGFVYLDQVAWTPLTQAMGCIAQLFEMLPFLGILYVLSKIFHRYEIGQIFTVTNAQSYNKIGKILFFDALIAQPISNCLLLLAVTLSNPPGSRYICLKLGTPNIMALLMGLLVILISWVMIKGSKIQDEQQLTI